MEQKEKYKRLFASIYTLDTIDVASVTKFLNLALAQGRVPETVREHYKLLEHHADECVGCQGCESRCPFGVKVADRMVKTAELFGR